MRIVLGLQAVLCLTGCASLPPTVHDFRNARTYEAGYGTVWSAVVDMFSDNQWKVDRLDEEAGVIVSGWVPDTSGGGDYGQGGTMKHIEPGSEQMAVNVRVVRVSDRETRVRVHCFFRARWMDNGKRMWGTGTSKGTYEPRMLGDLARALQ